MKKHSRTAAGAAAILLTAGLLSSTALAAVRGDLNGDGNLNARDAITLRDALLRKGSMSAEMDFDGDGKVTAKDLTLMKRSILYPAAADSDDIPEPTLPADMYANFRAGEAGDFFASDGWTNGKPFDCWWYAQNAQIKGGQLELVISENYQGKGNSDWQPGYGGGEFRTNDFYHYGYYETCMKAIKNDGVVSSFFTYTGPSDDNPWDEIDIEILGKDTTKVQLNYYKNGQGGHEQMIDLGFDSSEGYHKYGFDWQPDHITWYVDGKEVYTMRGDMPSTPGKIMMNAWPGRTVDDWLRAYNGNKPLTASYKWVTFKKSGSGSGNGGNDDPQPSGTIKDYGTPMNANATMVSNFKAGQAGDFFASDGWTNGKPFDCWWYADNAQIKGDHLELVISENYQGKGNSDWQPGYGGGEFRTNDFYHYGYYETSMQAIKNDGVVSSFFTYTGPSDDNPWDEIDIEILGKDTTKVQLNYYKNGQGGHEQMVDLGFDASEGYHTYGFDWQPDHITWYVDGKEIWTMRGDMPTTPGKIMMNAWPGRTVDEWLKAYNGNKPLTARYQWVTFQQSANSGSNGGNNNGNNNGGTTQSGIPDYGTAMNSSASMVSNFSAGSAGDFFASDGWTNGDPFNCGWYKNNTKISDGCLQLTIDRDYSGKYQYSGGEFRTNDFYHYGYYETSMQAIKNDGVVSSFFTYTGPSDNNPWDEIDIEILGKDTTKVQFNYYKDGQGGHEFMYDLGFDASQGFHTYGFDWQPDHITWYVDGKEAHTMWGSMPNTPGKIMMNVWPGIGVDEWLKAYNGNTPLTARYQWVTYKK